MIKYEDTHVTCVYCKSGTLVKYGDSEDLKCRYCGQGPEATPAKKTVTNARSTK